MDKNRLWIIGAVLLMVVVVAAGWVLGVQPQLASVDAAQTQSDQVAALNAQHEASLAQLQRDYRNLDPLNAQLAALESSVPSGTNLPAFVTELDGISAASGVKIKAVSVADPIAYAAVNAPGAPVAPSGTATPTPTPGATTPPVAPTKAPGMPPVSSALITPSNFSSLAVTLTVNGSYPAILNFVHGVQTGQRLFLVTGITTSGAQSAAVPGAAPAAPGAAAAAGGSSLSGTITGLIYVVTPPGKATSTAAPAAK